MAIDLKTTTKDFLDHTPPSVPITPYVWSDPSYIPSKIIFYHPMPDDLLTLIKSKEKYLKFRVKV